MLTKEACQFVGAEAAQSLWLSGVLPPHFDRAIRFFNKDNRSSHRANRFNPFLRRNRRIAIQYHDTCGAKVWRRIRKGCEGCNLCSRTSSPIDYGVVAAKEVAAEPTLMQERTENCCCRHDFSGFDSSASAERGSFVSEAEASAAVNCAERSSVASSIPSPGGSESQKMATSTGVLSMGSSHSAPCLAARSARILPKACFTADKLQPSSVATLRWWRPEATAVARARNWLSVRRGRPTMGPVVSITKDGTSESALEE